eukprot:gene17441-20041_t
MGPAMGERDVLPARRERLVDLIAVALRHTAKRLQKVASMGPATPGRVGEHRHRRVLAAVGPWILSYGPEEARMGSASSGIQHRDLGLIYEQVTSRQKDFPQPAPYRLQFASPAPGPTGDHMPLQLDPLPGHGLNLGIDRSMVSVLVHQDLRYERFGRQACLHHVGWSRRLDDLAVTSAASVFGADRDADEVLNRDHIQALCDGL